MSSKNAVSMIGNLVKDPDVQQTRQGLMVCNVRLALNRKFEKPDGEKAKEATFVDVAIWGARGEAFARYHHKGDLVAIDGCLRNDEWVDKESGQRRSALKVTAEEWYFVGERKSSVPPAGADESLAIADDTPF